MTDAARIKESEDLRIARQWFSDKSRQQIAGDVDGRVLLAEVDRQRERIKELEAKLEACSTLLTLSQKNEVGLAAQVDALGKEGARNLEALTKVMGQHAWQNEDGECSWCGLYDDDELPDDPDKHKPNCEWANAKRALSQSPTTTTWAEKWKAGVEASLYELVWSELFEMPNRDWVLTWKERAQAARRRADGE